MSRKSAFTRSFQRGVCSAITLLLLAPFLVSPLQAGTIVRFSTTVGDFSVELLDDLAPTTVANFLNYVNRNAYNGTYMHRVVDGFVAQGGGYRFEPFVGPIDVPADPPIANEFNRANTRGTLAMAKLPDDPNSATSQWFVNLIDNTSLDTTNGGFTVFGEVLGEGMEVLDRMDELPVVDLGAKAPSAPFYTPTFDRDPRNFVYVNVETVDRFSSAPHVFEVASGLLITSVNVNDGEELVSVNLNTVPGATDIVLQANMESVIPRRDPFTGIATFSSTDNKLRIPTLEVHDNGVVTLLNDVVFGLTSNEPVQFTLESYQEQAP